MHAFPKSPINSTKNGTQKNFASQWLSISPNSMTSFKFYVQMPFFSTFITLHLGKGHIQTVNRHSGQTSSATASLFNGVDSEGERGIVLDKAIVAIRERMMLLHCLVVIVT